MIFHENCLLVDNSHDISYLIGKMLQNLSSAAVVIGALRVKILALQLTFYCLLFCVNYFFKVVRAYHLKTRGRISQFLL